MQTTYRHAYKVKLFCSEPYSYYKPLVNWCEENLEYDFYVTSYWDTMLEKSGTLWFFENEEEAIWFKLVNAG